MAAQLLFGASGQVISSTRVSSPSQEHRRAAYISVVSLHSRRREYCQPVLLNSSIRAISSLLEPPQVQQATSLVLLVQPLMHSTMCRYSATSMLLNSTDLLPESSPVWVVQPIRFSSPTQRWVVQSVQAQPLQKPRMPTELR